MNGAIIRSGLFLWSTMTEKIFKNWEPLTESGCWVWLGACTAGGYGTISINKKTFYAHRLFYEFYRAPIPFGLQIDHLCRVRCCVNPDHLEIVTNRENTLRGKAVSALHARKTHCKRGHPFTPENTRSYPSVIGRRCKVCQKLLWGNEYRKALIISGHPSAVSQPIQ